MSFLLKSFILLALTSVSNASTIVPGGTLDHDEHWTMNGSPYILQSDLIIAGESTPRLTIDPGVVVIYPMCRIYISNNLFPGELFAVGTANLPIHFNNGYGNCGIVFNELSDINYANSRFEYCDMTGGDRALIIIGSSEPDSLSNIYIHDLMTENTGGYGIEIKDRIEQLFIINSRISHCCIGIFATNCNEPIECINIEIDHCRKTRDYDDLGGAFVINMTPSPILEQYLFHDNDNNGVIFTGVIDHDFYLDATDQDANIIYRNIRIEGPNNPRLTIAPGSTLHYKQDINYDNFDPSGVTYWLFDVSDSRSENICTSVGQITAVGAADQPISFICDDCTRQSFCELYNGIQFNSSSDCDSSSSFIDYCNFVGFNNAITINESSTPSQISNINIVDGLSDGIRLNGVSDTLSISNSSIVNSGRYPILLNGSTLVNATNIDITQNEIDRIGIFGHFSNNLTLGDGLYSRIEIPDLLDVSGPYCPILTLKSGCDVTLRTLWSEYRSAISCQNLHIEGNQVHPVSISGLDIRNSISCSSRNDVNGNHTRISNCIIDNIQLWSVYSSSQDTIKNIDARRSKFVILECDSVPYFDNIVFSVDGFTGDFPGDCIELINCGVPAFGYINKPTFFTANYNHDVFLDFSTCSTNLVFEDIIVHGSNNPCLTIAPGSRLKFLQWSGISIGRYDLDDNHLVSDCRGRLIARGTPDQPIFFTPTYVSDENGPSNTWQGIKFHPGSDYLGSASEMEYCEVSGAETNVSLNQTNEPHIFRNVKLENATDYGLSLTSSYIPVQESTFIGNRIGIYVNNSGTTVIGDSLQHACSFIGSRDYHVYNASSGTVYARNNMWCVPDNESIPAKIFDYNDLGTRGEVVFNPIKQFDELYLTVKVLANPDHFHLDWCPVLNAVDYNIYLSDHMIFDETAVMVGQTSNSYFDTNFPLSNTRGFYFVTANLNQESRQFFCQ